MIYSKNVKLRPCDIWSHPIGCRWGDLDGYWLRRVLRSASTPPIGLAEAGANLTLFPFEINYLQFTYSLKNEIPVRNMPPYEKGNIIRANSKRNSPQREIYYEPTINSVMRALVGTSWARVARVPRQLTRR